MLPLRPYTPLRMVLCLCGKCFEENPDREIDYQTDILQGSLVLMDGKVYLRRYCQRGHGEVVSLYEQDYELWNYLQQWRVPTKQLIPDTPGNYQPIPMNYLNGLGDLQTQHSCILLLDLTEACNLNCPTCFAESGTGINRYAQVEDVLRTLDAAIEREGGRIDVLMLSGGEPTLHPQLFEIIQAAAARKVTRVLLNTNGIRIAREDRFLAELAKLRHCTEVYLQFDGFSKEAHLYHRGEDLREVKRAAVERLSGARIFSTLVMAVSAGVNDGETGAVVRYAFDTDYIGGVSFQPVFGSGRAQALNPLQRVTPTGLMRSLGEQTGGLVGPQDFIGLPCSHPDCTSLTYFIKGDQGQYNSVPRLLGHERLKANLGLVSNTVGAFPGANAALRTALTGMMSETTTISRPELVSYVWNLCTNCELGLGEFAKQVASVVLLRQNAEEIILRRIKRLHIKNFMDAWSMNIERLQQCCVHVGTLDAAANPLRIPFCARQAFGALRARTFAGMLPVAELRPARGKGAR